MIFSSLTKTAPTGAIVPNLHASVSTSVKLEPSVMAK